jgi:hypothetical protein
MPACTHPRASSSFLYQINKMKVNKSTLYKGLDVLHQVFNIILFFLQFLTLQKRKDLILIS